MQMCYYGCGKEAKFQFKNGIWCCSIHKNKCQENRKKIKQKAIPIDTYNLCSFGCGKEAKFYFKTSNKFCCSKHTGTCPEIKKRNSETNKVKQSGESNGMFGKKHKNETKKIMKEKKIGKTWSEETRKKEKESWDKDNRRQKHIERMKNGQAAYMNKFIKNPSKPECMLRDIVLELYPEAIPQYTIFNYSLDVAIPKLKIAIEFDGWYHFDSEYSKEYFKNRKEKIEKEGWKIISYTIFEKFPLKEQVNNDIKSLL